MNLSKIKVDRCSICGAEVIKDELGFVHCNGTRQEFRSFSCGKKIEYSPNFDKIITVYECLNHPDIKLRTNNRKIAKEKVLELLEKLDVDEEWKRGIRVNMYN